MEQKKFEYNQEASYESTSGVATGAVGTNSSTTYGAINNSNLGVASETSSYNSLGGMNMNFGNTYGAYNSNGAFGMMNGMGADYGYEMPYSPCCPQEQTMMCPPVQECPQERVCHRYINYEVPHIMPCNTRVINHHVYKHTYTPYYTTCEENVVSNVYDRKCC